MMDRYLRGDYRKPNANTPLYFAVSGAEIPLTATSSTLDFTEVEYNVGFRRVGSKIYLKRNMYGLFKVTLEVTVEWETEEEGRVDFILRKNGGSAAIDFDAQVALSGHLGSSSYQPANTVSLTYIIPLEKNDYIEIAYSRDGDEPSIIENGGRILIEFISTYGFNNNAGGRIHYRGGIIR